MTPSDKKYYKRECKGYYKQFANAYKRLYRSDIPEEAAKMVQQFIEHTIPELKELYNKQMNSEQEIGGKILTYIDEGADINTRNVEDVIEAIKRKMEEQVMDKLNIICCAESGEKAYIEIITAITCF